MAGEEKEVKELGEYLKRLRKRNELTASELGKRTGYSQSHISGIENGQKGIPSGEFLRKYLLEIADSGHEYLKYVDVINNIFKKEIITTEEFKDKLKDTFANEEQPSKFLRWGNEEKGYMKAAVYDFPINDIEYMIKDKFNEKFYGDNIIENDDKEYLTGALDNMMLLRQEFALKVLADLEYKKIISTDTYNEYAWEYCPDVMYFKGKRK